jgi:hypothetical protein
VAWKAPEIAEEIDRSVVARPRQVRALLAAIDAQRPELTGFFGCLYYGYMRPGEAKLLRKRDCVDLPDNGWGHLLLTSNAPVWAPSGPTPDRVTRNDR